jgi:hypothetical protein
LVTRFISHSLLEYDPHDSLPDTSQREA